MASELRRRTRAARRVAAWVVGFSECRRPRPLRPMGGVGGRVARTGSTRAATRGAEDDAEAEDAACEVEVAAAEAELEVVAEAETDADAEEALAEVAAEAEDALRSLVEIPPAPLPAVSAAAPRIVAAGRAAPGR